MRVSGRLFPDALQVGIAALLIVPQSRVTFSGQRGTVRVEWNVRCTNAGAVLVTSILGVGVGTAQFVARGNGAIWFEATAGINGKLHALTIFVDPPAGSFIELQVTPASGSFDIPADAGQISVISWPLEIGEGHPEITSRGHRCRALSSAVR